MLLCKNPGVLPLLALLRLLPPILRRKNELIATIDRNNPSRRKQYSSHLARQNDKNGLNRGVNELIAK
jgi:hypothetical protein